VVKMILEVPALMGGSLLSGLFAGELALPLDKAVEPSEGWVAFDGARGVYVPVEGLAVVAEATVELADEVRRDGELAAHKALCFEGAQEVADGPKLEGALEGTLAFFAADPRGTQAEVAELAGGEGALLAADLGGVEGEPGWRARAENAQETIFFEALLEVVTFDRGEIELVEALAGGEGAGRAHGDAVPDQA